MEIKEINTDYRAVVLQNHASGLLFEFTGTEPSSYTEHLRNRKFALSLICCPRTMSEFTLTISLVM